MNIAKIIRNRRNEVGLSAVEAAAEAGISYSLWTKLESNQDRNPTAATLAKIARTLHLPVTELLSAALEEPVAA